MEIYNNVPSNNLCSTMKEWEGSLEEAEVGKDMVKIASSWPCSTASLKNPRVCICKEELHNMKPVKFCDVLSRWDSWTFILYLVCIDRWWILGKEVFFQCIAFGGAPMIQWRACAHGLMSSLYRYLFPI